MTNYNFYIVENVNTPKSKIQDELNLQEAIIKFKNSKEVSKTLGVSKDDLYSCDLVRKNSEGVWLSQDYTKMENFKDDTLITVNTISILKRELLMEECTLNCEYQLNKKCNYDVKTAQFPPHYKCFQGH